SSSLRSGRVLQAGTGGVASVEPNALAARLSDSLSILRPPGALLSNNLAAARVDRAIRPGRAGVGGRLPAGAQPLIPRSLWTGDLRSGTVAPDAFVGRTQQRPVRQADEVVHPADVLASEKGPAQAAIGGHAHAGVVGVRCPARRNEHAIGIVNIKRKATEISRLRVARLPNLHPGGAIIVRAIDACGASTHERTRRQIVTLGIRQSTADQPSRNEALAIRKQSRPRSALVNAL